MLVFSVLNIIIVALLLFSHTCFIVGFGPAGGKQNDSRKKNNSNLFHTIWIVQAYIRRFRPSRVLVRISLNFGRQMDKTAGERLVTL